MRASLPGVLLISPLLLACAVVPARAEWPHDPNVNVPLCTATNHQQPCVAASDGAGGAIVAWRDLRNGSYHIYAQRVSSDGAVRWTADGVALCTAAGDQHNPAIVSDGAGGAIVTWQDQRTGVVDIYAQRISSAGAVQWASNGVALCAATGSQTHPAIASDAAGGAIVAWQDERAGASDVYAQQISAAGAPQWTADGVAVCTATNSQGVPTIASDGAGGAIVAWQDFRSGTDYAIYAQRISAAGATQWTSNGAIVCNETNAQELPQVVSDGAGGAVFAWQDYRGGSNYDVYAQRISAAGSAVWTSGGVALCTATGNQSNPTLATDGAGGAIVAWHDTRGGAYDIYAQRISGGGVVQWAGNGVALCSAADNQTYPAIVPDGAGGAVVAWQDGRSGANDIYAEHVSSAGGPQWAANGAAVSTAANAQIGPVLAADGTGGAVVAWSDFRGNAYYDIYAQRIERFGYLGNPEPVIAAVKDVANDQGGRVKVSWDASWLDVASDANLTAYDVLRSIPTRLVSASLAGSRRVVPVEQAAAGLRVGDVVAQPAGTETYYWEYLATVTPVHYLAGYSYLAATAADSVAGSNPCTAFMVVGRNSSYTKYWLSAPDSGYSVDDLAPDTPTLLAGEYASGASTLHWAMSREGDLAGYRLYRGETADFVPGAGNLVAEPADTGYVDVGGRPYWYKLSAVDVHGNESGYAVLLPSGITGVDGSAPAALALSLASANPARGGARLRWSLPAEGEARLVVYDVAGRAVRELASGRAGAGEHATSWDGRDGAGGLAPAGMYVARLEAAGRNLSVRFVLVR